MENVTKTMNAEGTKLEVRRQSVGAQKGRTYGNSFVVKNRPFPSEEDVLRGYRDATAVMTNLCADGGTVSDFTIIIRSQAEALRKGTPAFTTVGWKFSVVDPE